MRIQIEDDLIIEAIAGLMCYGGAATTETVAKLKKSLYASLKKVGKGKGDYGLNDDSDDGFEDFR